MNSFLAHLITFFLPYFSLLDMPKVTKKKYKLLKTPKESLNYTIHICSMVCHRSQNNPIFSQINTTITKPETRIVTTSGNEESYFSDDCLITALIRKEPSPTTITIIPTTLQIFSLRWKKSRWEIWEEGDVVDGEEASLGLAAIVDLLNVERQREERDAIVWLGGLTAKRALLNIY